MQQNQKMALFVIHEIVFFLFTLKTYWLSSYFNIQSSPAQVMQEGGSQRCTDEALQYVSCRTHSWGTCTFLTYSNKTQRHKTSTDLPMSRNSPTSPWRLIAMRMLRTVIPSQKHATTLALGRWALSLSSSRSKLCSPALLQIFPEEACRTNANVSSDSNDMTESLSCFRCNRDFQDIQMMRREQADLCC